MHSCRHRLFLLDRLLFKRVFEDLAGYVGRGAGDHDFAAADTAFQAQVDDPVGGLDCP